MGKFPKSLKALLSLCSRRVSKAGDKHTNFKTVPEGPCNSASQHRARGGMVPCLLYGAKWGRSWSSHRAEQRWQLPPCHQYLPCTRNRNSLPCPKLQLVRQKLYQVTGHRNVTLCLMRFSKSPVIWKECVHSRVISLAKGTLVVWQGSKLPCTYVQIWAVCRFEILKQIHYRLRTLWRSEGLCCSS